MFTARRYLIDEKVVGTRAGCMRGPHERVRPLVLYLLTVLHVGLVGGLIANFAAAERDRIDPARVRNGVSDGLGDLVREHLFLALQCVEAKALQVGIGERGLVGNDRVVVPVAGASIVDRGMVSQEGVDAVAGRTVRHRIAGRREDDVDVIESVRARGVSRGDLVFDDLLDGCEAAGIYVAVRGGTTGRRGWCNRDPNVGRADGAVPDGEPAEAILA